MTPPPSVTVGKFVDVKWSIVVGVCAIALTTVGCQASEGSDPPDTVGSLPIADVATTLLPDVVVSYVPDDTLPPGVLFGGLLCTALSADDFEGVVVAGAGRATLLQTLEVADDVCGFVVRAGGDEYTILVRARNVVDFEQPATSDFDPEALTGVGQAAMGVTRSDDTYEVYVRVAAGYFSVNAPDRASALALARAAVGNSEQSAP